MRSSEEKMLQVWWETIALFIFPGETEAVIVSAERKPSKQKFNLNIAYLPFLCQNKKKKAQYAFKFWKCYTTLRIKFTLLNFQ